MKCGSLFNFFISFYHRKDNDNNDDEMAGKVDEKILHDLRVFADRLRIDSIRSTNASKSG